MIAVLKNAELLKGFFEDDGSALWFEIGEKDGNKVRVELSAMQFASLMGQLTDLQYQVQSAQIGSIDTQAMSALKSYGEHAQVSEGGNHVVALFQVNGHGTRQAYAVPSERAEDFAKLVQRCATQALASAKKPRH
jgi:hypothetical protein